MNSENKCPVMSTAHQAVGETANQHWWPNQLNLRILRQNHPQADPNGEEKATGEVCLDGEKYDRMACQARADYQFYAIGRLQLGYSSLDYRKIVRFPQIWMAYGECRLRSAIT